MKATTRWLTGSWPQACKPGRAWADHWQIMGKTGIRSGGRVRGLYDCWRNWEKSARYINSKRTCRRRKINGSWRSMRSNTRIIRSMRRMSRSKRIWKKKGRRQEQEDQKKQEKNMTRGILDQAMKYEKKKWDGEVRRRKLVREGTRKEGSSWKCLAQERTCDSWKN